MTEYRKGSHAVFDLNYHIVWITKYRKAVLRGETGVRHRKLIRQTCEAQEVYIEKGHIAVDHVHLLLSVPPNIAVSDLVQRLKGRSSRKMLEEFGELRRQYLGQHLGTRIFSSEFWQCNGRSHSAVHRDAKFKAED